MLCLVSQALLVSNAPASAIPTMWIRRAFLKPVHVWYMGSTAIRHSAEYVLTGQCVLITHVLRLLLCAIWFIALCDSDWLLAASGRDVGWGVWLQVLVLSVSGEHKVCMLGTFSGSPLYCGLCWAGGAVICFWFLVLVSSVWADLSILQGVAYSLKQWMPTERNVRLWMFIL